jgi:hypothetical protein
VHSFGHKSLELKANSIHHENSKEIQERKNYVTANAIKMEEEEATQQRTNATVKLKP